MPEQSQIDAEARGGDIEQRLAALEAWQDKMRRNGLSAMEIRPGLMRYGANVQQLDNNGQQILSGSGGTTMVYFVPELSSDPNNEDIKSRIQGVNSATLAELVADSSITSLGLQGKVFTYASNQANDVAGIRLDPLTPDIVQNTNIDVYAQRSNTFGNMVLTNIVFRLGSFTSDPGSLADGDMWYRSDTDVVRLRANGATISLGSGVATDTIWNAAGDLAVGTGADTATVLSGSSEDSYYLRYSTAINSPVWNPWLKVSNQTGDFSASGGFFYRVSGTTTVTMPLANIDGRVMRIINVGSGNVTVNRTSSDTFFYGTTGLTSHTILPGECFTYTAYAAGNEWLVS